VRVVSVGHDLIVHMVFLTQSHASLRPRTSTFFVDTKFKRRTGEDQRMGKLTQLHYYLSVINKRKVTGVVPLHGPCHEGHREPHNLMVCPLLVDYLN
jgi:hypothetical protein